MIDVLNPRAPGTSWLGPSAQLSTYAFPIAASSFIDHRSSVLVTPHTLSQREKTLFFTLPFVFGGKVHASCSLDHGCSVTRTMRRVLRAVNVAFCITVCTSLFLSYEERRHDATYAVYEGKFIFGLSPVFSELRSDSPRYT